MKNNFKKFVSLALIVLMLTSMFCISASAATYTITLKGGTRKLNGETYAGELNPMLLGLSGNTYTDENGTVYTIDKENHTVTFSTDASGYVTFPEFFFVMEGHTQSAWGTSATSNGSSNYKEGKRLKVNGAKTYYARYDTIKYSAEFLPGADGEGTSQKISNKTYGASVTMPGAIFTRAGHVQIGWASVENASAVEYALGDNTFKIKSNVEFYPVWQKVVFSLTYDVKTITFGSICEGYTAPAAQVVTITNNSNSAVSFTAPSSAAYTVVASATTIPADGGTITVTINPKTGLAVGSYLENLSFDFGIPDINFVLPVKFVVNDHVFVQYEPVPNTATYAHNGKEIAKCHLGCGAEHEREQANSQKKYLVENNTADGLLEEYLYHKTVKFVAFGSGMDDAEGVIGKRFRPTEWAVADTQFGGKFAETYTKDYDAADYTVKYDHGDGNFGTYTLTIKYVEEEKVDGEWVATGIEDVKTFKYSIGPSEKDNQEVVRPNMIVSIIFGLFGYLFDLISSGSLF